jgi:hypothetical protein
MITRHQEAWRLYVLRPFSWFGILALFGSIAAPGAAIAAAQQDLSLTSVARVAHLDYAWLAADEAVQLSGPNIVLVIRPGNNLYDVNDRVETTSIAPRYASNDIYVSPQLAARIETLGRQAWHTYSNARSTEAWKSQDVASYNELRGTIVMNVTQLKGAEALMITGQAPPSAPIRITLLATLSSDLPNVLIGRHDINSGSDGTFQAIVPIGPDYIQQTFLHVTATSGPGVTPASAQILVDAPNAGVKVPWEQIPGGIW